MFLLMAFSLPVRIQKSCGYVWPRVVATSVIANLRPASLRHRNTPTDCTSTTGGTSSGESTTTFGKKGSSRRFR